MLSWIILLLLRYRRYFSVCFVFFLVDSDSFSSKYSSFFLLYLLFGIRLSRWFLIVQGRCKINIYICVNDANCIVWGLWGNFQNIDVKLLIESSNRNRVSLMQTGEVSQLILKDSLWIVSLDEFCPMWP